MPPLDARDLLENVADGVVVHDAETGEIRDVNGRFCDLSGYDREELLGATVDLVSVEAPGYEHEAAQELLAQAQREGAVKFEWRNETKAGEVYPVEVHLSIGPDGEFAVATVRDSSERKAREREQREMAEYRDAIFESIPFPVYALDVEDYAVEHANTLAKVQAGDTCYEVTHQRDEPCDEGSEETLACPLSEVQRTGESVAVEHTHYDADGTERIYEVHASPIFDDDGNVAQIVESNVDITDRVEYRQRLETQRDDLELLNQVVRHDIRNDLQLVLTYAELLEDRVAAEERAYVETLLESTRNAIEVTTTAREMADVMLRDDHTRQRVSLRQTLLSELDEVRSAQSSALVSVDGAIPDVTVLANDMLDSVFRNLLQNAIQHNDAEIPEVTVSATVGADTVTVEIADNGPGVPDEQKEAIFGKGEKGLDSSGTGLGLYLVRTLIESYGGDIWVADRAEHRSAGNRPQTGDREGQSPSANRTSSDDDPEGAVFVVELPRGE
ncbi:PAS domain S-box protein [Halorientalis brevis]|uniref:histidine kinase n=1 Tax=Halorientalis brevis TaxID=1126241 RepID=A0ABD6CB07_9EURY|nr:PAS domain-containing sensor histidine kinase [Halorientalis brevis]